MAPLPNPRFTRFWHEVDAQLASLGADDAWSHEILSRYDDGLTVHETALAIIEARDDERPRADMAREHSTLDHRTQGI